MTDFFKGVATAMVTPFDENGVNFSAFGKMIERQITGGTDALVIIGTTGEPSTMTEDERTDVIKFSVEKCKGRIKLIIGAGSNCTAKAIENARVAEELGADGILAVTPYYNKCTQSGIYKYYFAICKAVNIPVIAYNVPSRTGVNISPETAEKLVCLPNMAGIKEASGNMAQASETMRRIRGKADLYCGEDALNLPMTAIGAAGYISVVSNVAPELVKELYNCASGGNYIAANEINDKLLPLAAACFCEVNPIPVKEAYNLLGYEAGTPRAPLTRLEENNAAILKKELQKAGLL